MEKSRYWIGVDLHSRVIQVCVLDRAGETCHQARVRGAGLREGLELVEELARRFPQSQVAVEAVGCNRWFVAACREAGLCVTVVHAARLELKRSGRKTDRRDAYELARRLRLGDLDRNATSYHPTDEEYGLRQLLRRRHKFVQTRTNFVTQVRGMLRAHRIEQPGEIPRPKNLALLRAIRLQDENEAVALEALTDAVEALEASIRKLDKQLVRACRSHAGAAMLQTLPYVGPVTGLTLAAELGDVQRFRNSKAVASYAGLVPRVCESADRSFHGRLVPHGNRELRFVLGEWAVQLLARHPEVKLWAEPRLRRSPRNKVRIALARRLLIGVWHTLRTGEMFSMERCLASA